MSWIICIVLVFLSLSLIARLSFFDVKGLSRVHFMLAYFAKLMAAIFFIMLYTYYYSNRSEADVYKYFDDGLILYEVSQSSIPDFITLSTGIGGNVEELSEKYLANTRFWDKSPALPFLNDNRLIIRFNALMNVISHGNIYVHIVVAVFISFLGLTMLLKFFMSQYETESMLPFLVIFLTPSLVFWTSSVLKESFLIFGLGGFLMSMSTFRKSILLSIMGLMVYAFIILLSKVYILAILIPACLAFLWNENKSDGKSLLRYTSIFLLFFSLSISLKWLINYDLLGAIAFKQSEFKCLAEWTGAGSVVYLPDTNNSLISFIYASPFALYNALFRPMPWDVNSLIEVMAMLETMSIILLLVFVLIFRKKTAFEEKNILHFSFFIILSLAVLIGLTTPVLGAIVRYRIILLPLLILPLLMMLDMKKLSKFVGQTK